MRGSTRNDASSWAPPPWIGRCIAVVFITVCLLDLWALLVGAFIPSGLGWAISWAAAIGAAVLMGVWTYFDPMFAHDTPERAARLARAPLMADPVARMLLVGAFMGLATFGAVSGAILEFWTLAVGRPTTLTWHLGGYHSSSRHNCAGFDLQEAPWQLRRSVCARYGYYEAPPPGTPIVVQGPSSAVGVQIERFTIL